MTIDFTPTIQTLFQADATLTSICTGGILRLEDVGRLGITRTGYPSAFANGIIKPLILLKQRSTQPFDNNPIMDEQSQYRSVTCIVECWLYESIGYTNINSMRDRIYNLLQNTILSTGGHVLFNYEIREQRDTTIDANVERVDYSIIYLRKGI